ncbi:Fot2 transposase [Fusarium beomiforme]|uniref:Fot2 transposase n=1 Tax=Fusarium beomiforme TaxID=44412 RepID=A0A9P5ABY2_9HYPO|nr:Fot2 transposase [Fusarium beomiforme]
MASKRPRSVYTEDNMADAILDITENGLSQQHAAQKHGIPQQTISDRFHDQTALDDQVQPNRHLSRNQEANLVSWILRQESLGYAPSHSQIRACVVALLKQQNKKQELGRNWVAKFIKRHSDLKTKLGRRQEANRFNSFTPKAVHWYFDIREEEYGWIKRENTVNVDEGGIMTGFGLDSLVVGSSDPKRKALLKSPQSRNWTSFIEAITADGRALTPGIIFKGKALQQQWFLEEFRKIADWNYITSPNGWTDNHIAIEWLERPLDNGVFNASKTAYRKELEKLASLTDSAPVDKVNFIRAYAKAREVAMTSKNILSGWRITGNWPISRAKALRHPEIQADRVETTPEPVAYLGSDDTPKTSRQIRDLSRNKSPGSRKRYSVIARGFEAQEQAIAAHAGRITSLEEEVARLKRGKKRRAIPNPNRRFMTLGEALIQDKAIPEVGDQGASILVDSESEEVVVSDTETASEIEVTAAPESPQITTRSRRLVKKPK